MKRLRRIIFNALAALSLVLSLAFTILWAESYWRCARMWFVSADGRDSYEMWAWKGRLEFAANRTSVRHPRYQSYRGFGHDSIPSNSIAGLALRNSFAGISWYRETDLSGYRWMGVAISDYYLIALFAALPMIRLYSHLRRRRVLLPGRCPKCGYDLRATPDRCPECGTIPTELKT